MTRLQGEIVGIYGADIQQDGNLSTWTGTNVKFQSSDNGDVAVGARIAHQRERDLVDATRLRVCAGATRDLNRDVLHQGLALAFYGTLSAGCNAAFCPSPSVRCLHTHTHMLLRL